MCHQLSLFPIHFQFKFINFPSSQFTFKFKLLNFSFSQSNSNSNANSIHSHYIPLSLTFLLPNDHPPSLYKPPLFSTLPHIFTSLLLLKLSSISSTLNLSFLPFYTFFTTHSYQKMNLQEWRGNQEEENRLQIEDQGGMVEALAIPIHMKREW